MSVWINGEQMGERGTKKRNKNKIGWTDKRRGKQRGRKNTLEKKDSISISLP